MNPRARGLPVGPRPPSEWSAEERRNVATVTALVEAFIARDAAAIAAQFTDEGVFHVGPVGAMPPPMRMDWKAFTSATSIEMKVVETCPMGPMVMHDRYDRIIWPHRRLVGRWIGVFALRDGKIAEFTDYTLNYDEW